VGSSSIERSIQIATCVVLFVAGALLGTIETFLVPQRIFGGLEGLAVLLAFGGNTILGSIGGIGTRSMAGAAAPLVGWFIAVATFTFISIRGDVVVPGKLPSDPGIVVVGEAALALGLLGALVAVFATMYFTLRREAPTSDA
jgi:hypothetical protein